MNTLGACLTIPCTAVALLANFVRASGRCPAGPPAPDHHSAHYRDSPFAEAEPLGTSGGEHQFLGGLTTMLKSPE